MEGRKTKDYVCKQIKIYFIFYIAESHIEFTVLTWLSKPFLFLMTLSPSAP